MRLELLTAILAATAQPTAAPGAETSVIDRAMTARAAGDYRSAITLLETETRAAPNDATLLRLLGATYAFAGRYEDAIATLRRARAIAPGDQDIALALARAYLWSGRIDEAAAAADQIALADPANNELAAVRTSIAAARTPVAGGADRATAAASISQSISHVVFDRGGDATWYDSAASLALPLGPGATLTAGLARESRADIADTRIEARLDTRVGVAGYAYVGLTATPHADFRERWGVRAGGEVPLARYLSASLDLRYLDYRDAQVVVAEPGLRVHAEDERWSLTLKSINLWNDGYRNGWSVRGEWQAGEAIRIVAGGATYPDTEAGVTRRTRSAFVGTVVTLSEQVTLRATYDHDRRAETYSRDGGAVAVSVRF